MSHRTEELHHKRQREGLTAAESEEVQREDRLAQLGVVAAGLAHEIKNPLAGIRGAAQLLQDRISTDPSAVEYATVMIREIDRLSSLLEQVLRLSAPPRLEFWPVNVHKVLTDVLLLERATAPSGVKILTHFDPSLPDVLGDEAQLAQVFRNLIKNGLQTLADRQDGTALCRSDGDCAAQFVCRPRKLRDGRMGRACRIRGTGREGEPCRSPAKEIS